MAFKKETYSLTVLGVQNQGVSRSVFPLKVLGRDPSLSLLASGVP